MQVSHYDILKADPSANAEELKKAYRKRLAEARLMGEGEALFAAIEASYAVLSDPASRQAYDQSFAQTSKALKLAALEKAAADKDKQSGLGAKHGAIGAAVLALAVGGWLALKPSPSPVSTPATQSSPGPSSSSSPARSASAPALYPSPAPIEAAPVEAPAAEQAPLAGASDDAARLKAEKDKKDKEKKDKEDKEKKEKKDKEDKDKKDKEKTDKEKADKERKEAEAKKAILAPAATPTAPAPTPAPVAAPAHAAATPAPPAPASGGVVPMPANVICPGQVKPVMPHTDILAADVRVHALVHAGKVVSVSATGPKPYQAAAINAVRSFSCKSDPVDASFDMEFNFKQSD